MADIAGLNRRQKKQVVTMKPEEWEQGVDQNMARVLKEYGTAARDAAERDDGFWERQRLAVMTGVGRQQPVFRSRHALAWGAAAVIILIVIGLRIEVPEALPVPDIAGGYDQDLLADVDRILCAPTSLALEPALLLARDISTGSETRPDGYLPEARRGK